MSAAEIRKSAEARMAKSLDTLQIQPGRVDGPLTPILDHVQVDYYSSPVPVGQVANVNLVDAQRAALRKANGRPD